MGFHSPSSVADGADLLDALREGPLAAWLEDATPLAAGPDDAPEQRQAAVFAGYRLQDIADYRAAIQRWFAAVRPGGHLIIVVPHAFLFERQISLPSRWRPKQARLYTPRSLIEEVEEALVPNTYRVRWLGDLDSGYDYGRDWLEPPVGRHDVAVVLERIAPPVWGLKPEPTIIRAEPAVVFEPRRTRLEVDEALAHHKILALKLDHLGDFIMGVPALRRLRATFPGSEITLVVGPWNAAVARELGVADHVLSFDLYPRNSSEEEVDVRGKTALFDRFVAGEYDLAIDLRTDADTRFLLRNVHARVKAGMGTKAEFPFLDIFVPIDRTRHDPETAGEQIVPPTVFAAQNFCTRNPFKIGCAREDVRWDKGALIWGPYWQLRPGRFIWEPFIETDAELAPGILSVDVAIDAKWRAFEYVPSDKPIRLGFEVEKPGSRFEARVWAVDGEAPLAFNFFGGRLYRQAAASVLHQSEYLSLLIELIRIRVAERGVLRDLRR